MENRQFGAYSVLEKVRATKLIETYRAIKVVGGIEHCQFDLFDPQISSNQKFLQAFKNFRQKLSVFTEADGIIPVIDSGIQDKHFFLKRKYFITKSLRQMIDESNDQVFPISVEHGVLIINRVTTILQHMHHQVEVASLPYYLTPDNILANFDGEIFLENLYFFPALFEIFGQNYKIIGPAFAYLPPEYIKSGHFNETSIVYVLGALLYEILSGKPLCPPTFKEYKNHLKTLTYPDKDSFEEEIDEEMIQIVRKMVDIAPDKRYTTLAELKETLDNYIYEGNYSPTTFNFVFFLNTLFRDEYEKKTKKLEEEAEQAQQQELKKISEAEQKKLEEANPDIEVREMPLWSKILIGVIILGAIIYALIPKKKKEGEQGKEQIVKEKTVKPKPRPGQAPASTEQPAEETTDEAEATLAPDQEAQTPEPAPQPREEADMPQAAEESQPAAQQEEPPVVEETQTQTVDEPKQPEAEISEPLVAEEPVVDTIAPLIQAAQDSLAAGDLATARQKVNEALAQNAGNQAANDLLLQIELEARKQRKAQEQELLNQVILAAEADVPPKTVKTPTIDLSRIIRRIPSTILADLKTRVRRIITQLVVSEKGDVVEVTILAPKNIQELLESTGVAAAVKEQMKKAKYTPAVKDGKKRKCRIVVPISNPW